MEHDLELFSPILEILEIGVCNIIYNPGNIGKRIFSLSPILEIVDRTIHICSYVDVAGGRGGSPGVAGGRGGSPGAAEPSGGPGGGAPRRAGGRIVTAAGQFNVTGIS